MARRGCGDTLEYVGEKHAQHLLNILKKYHTVSEDWEGKKFAGIDLEWNYDKVHSKRTCRLSMREYIKKLLHKIGHPMPRKPQLSPHRARDVKYGSKDSQMTPEEDTSSKLDEKGIKRVQMIV